jgi:simple sugar transport system permease protein
MPEPVAAAIAPPRFTLGRPNLEVRQSIAPWKQAAFVALCLAIGLGISLVLLLLSGVGLGSVWEEFVLFTFFDSKNLTSVLVECSPLVLVGLGAAAGFRVRFWNIGIEGQVMCGALGATFVAIFDIGPAGARLCLMALAAILAGLAWVIVPLILKLKLAVNEIISTLLLNYVAYLLVLNQVYGPWQDKKDPFPHSEQFDLVERLPKLGWESTDVSLAIAVVVTLLMWWLMQRSHFGTYTKFVDANRRMALAVGVPVTLVTSLAVGASASLSGLAGFVISAGQEYRLTPTLAEGYGFSAIVIAFLARNNPIAVAVVAFLMGGLFVAGQNLQVFYNLPAAVVGLIQAIIVMSVAASEFFIRYRLRWVR